MNLNPFASDYSLFKGTEPPAHGASQSFGRYEFKYILTAAKRAAVERELREFMEVDPFSYSQPEHSYFVRSLYYDDSGFSDYHQKIDGVLNRSKFRLRTYSSTESDSCFLEMKGRQNMFSYKQRTLLEADTLQTLLAQRWSSLAREVSGSPLLARFVVAACRRNLSPRVLVDYRRRPYIGRRDYRFRVTLDDRLQASAADTLFPVGVRRMPVLEDCSIMEIKFEHMVPLWFHRLIGANELRRISVSKYCLCTEALTLVRSAE
jgi:hypothetical protein